MQFKFILLDNRCILRLILPDIVSCQFNVYIISDDTRKKK